MEIPFRNVLMDKIAELQLRKKRGPGDSSAFKIYV